MIHYLSSTVQSVVHSGVVYRSVATMGVCVYSTACCAASVLLLLLLLCCRLERPMIANISLTYNPTVHRFLPMITMAGAEYLSIEFPLTTYPGHLMVGANLQSS
jgi:hypothetical protein